MSSFRSCRGRLTALFALSAWALILTSNSLAAPTDLEAGDVSVIGYQLLVEPVTFPPPLPDGDDQIVDRGISFSFVTWVDLNPGTEIGFTESGYKGNGQWYGERSMIWSTDQTVAAGSVIRLTHDVDSETRIREPDMSATEGQVTGFLALTLIPDFNVGDQIFAYQGTLTGSRDEATFTGTPIFGLNTDYEHGQGWLDDDEQTITIGANESKLPASLRDAEAHAEIVGTMGGSPHVFRNGKFDRDKLTSIPATIAEYQAAIRDPSNWQFSDDKEAIDWLDDTSFDIVAEIPEPAVAIGALILTAGFLLPFRLRDRRGQG